MHQTNIFIHVLTGALALLIGMIPFFSKKGGKLHILSGRIFMILIMIVITTALIGVTIFRDRPFLTLITLQSFYMCSTGYLAIKYKEKGPGILTLIIVLIMLVSLALFLNNITNSNIVWNKGLVYYLMGYMSLFIVYDILRLLKLVKYKNDWLLEHLLKMTSAFNAVFSAAVGTVLSAYEPYSQVWASGVSTLLLIFVIYWFVKRRNTYFQ